MKKKIEKEAVVAPLTKAEVEQMKKLAVHLGFTAKHGYVNMVDYLLNLNQQQPYNNEIHFDMARAFRLKDDFYQVELKLSEVLVLLNGMLSTWDERFEEVYKTFRACKEKSREVSS